MKNNKLNAFLFFLFVSLLYFLPMPVLAGKIFISNIHDEENIIIAASDNEEYEFLNFSVKASDDEDIRLNSIKVTFFKPENENFIEPTDLYGCNIYTNDSDEAINSSPQTPDWYGKILFRLGKEIKVNEEESFRVACKIPYETELNNIKATLAIKDIDGIGVKSTFKLRIIAEDIYGHNVRIFTGKPDLIISDFISIPGTMELIDKDIYKLGDHISDELYKELTTQFKVRVSNLGEVKAILKEGSILRFSKNIYGHVLLNYKLESDVEILPDDDYDFTINVGPNVGLRTQIDEFNIIAQVDFNNTVDEIDEDNNSFVLKNIKVVNYGELHFHNDNHKIDSNEFYVGDKATTLARYKILGFDAEIVQFNGLGVMLNNCHNTIRNVHIYGGTEDNYQLLSNIKDKFITNNHVFSFDEQSIPIGDFYEILIKGDIIGECYEDLSIGVSEISTFAKVNTRETWPILNQGIVIKAKSINDKFNNDYNQELFTNTDIWQNEGSTGIIGYNLLNKSRAKLLVDDYGNYFNKKLFRNHLSNNSIKINSQLGNNLLPIFSRLLSTIIGINY